MTFKTSKLAITAWCLYDWANSAFPTVVTTFIFAAYFTRQIASNTIIGTSQWGNATALAGLIIALSSPIFGAIADYGGRLKYWLAAFSLLVIISSALLWFAHPSSDYVYFTLTCVVFGTIGIETGMVFYNALLPRIAPPAYLGRISGWAWGLGYAGGLAALVIALFGFVETAPSWLNPTTAEQVRICGPLIAAWFAVFALPLFLVVPDYPVKNQSLYKTIIFGLTSLWETLKNLPQQKAVLYFLIAHMIYIDGLNTVFAFGGIYAAGTFGMNMTEIVQFGIVMNIAAGFGAVIFAWIDDLIGSKPTILIALIALALLGIGIVIIQTKFWFWILATLLCLFVGPVQSASRSLMVRLVQAEKVTEMFGLYAFSGKATTFIGPWLLGIVTLHFHSQRFGMASVMIFFIIGGIILTFVRKPKT